MDEPPRKIPLVFYRTTAGVDVVREWLRGLDKADRDIIGQDLMRVQFRWPVGMPLRRPLGTGLWEVRSNLPNNRIARVLFSWIKALSAWCTASSRRPGKRRRRRSIWPISG